MADIIKCRSDAGTVTLTREGVLECFIVPYNTPAPIIELDDRSRVDAYLEGFRPSAFERQVAGAAKERGVAGRILLKDGHTDLKLGQFRSLTSTDEGLFGEAKVMPSKIDDVADLVAEGITGLSVEFVPMGREDRRAEVRWRERAHLEAVSIVPLGAYESASIIKMREADEVVKAEQERRRALAEIEEFVETERDRWAHLR